MKSNKTDKIQWIWSDKEEKTLTDTLKEVVRTRWKSENEFHSSYLTLLENEMQKAFFWKHIYVEFLISSHKSMCEKKKKNHGSLVTMLTRSVMGWSYTNKMIDLSLIIIFMFFFKFFTCHNCTYLLFGVKIYGDILSK